MTELSRFESARGIDAPPTPKQLHGLTGQLMKVAYESGRVRRREYMNDTEASKRIFLPDWSTSVESLDGYGNLEQVDKRITASLGSVAHRFWSLRIRITDTRASYCNDMDENDPAGTGLVSAGQLFGSVAPDKGVQSQYSFEWNRERILRAQRRIVSVPSNIKDIPSVQELISKMPETDIDEEFRQVLLLSEMSSVSSADIEDLREEVVRYREGLSSRSAW